MKTKILKKLALSSTVFLISLCVFSQPEFTTYKKSEVKSGIIRVKFSNKDAIMNKIASAHLSSQDMSSLKATASMQYIEIPELSKLNRLNQKYGVIEMSRVFRHAGKHEEKHKAFGLHLWYEIKYSGNTDIEAIVRSYSNISYIQAANPVYTAQLTGNLPNGANDPRYDEQWHYQNGGSNGGTVDADIDLEEAWTIETGNSNVVVAIEDGGIDVDHNDLAGNIWVNPGEIAGNGIDDDNNGFVDDINGWNFVNNSGTIVAHSHGTHVAGTVGAETNNGIGVSGVAGGSGSNDGVRLMSCQVFTSNSSGGFAEAYTYAADNGAVISQNSWGYRNPGVYDQAVLDGIDYFIANAGGSNEAMDGGIVIFAAGNDNSNGQYWPGYYSPTLAVAATNNEDIKAQYSNYGSWVDIAAPGGELFYSGDPRGVLSTLPNNSYGFNHGTSMACPHVSGVAALVVSKSYGNITPSELRNILVDHVDDIDGINPNYSGLLGSGRLNAYKALSAGQIDPPEIATNPNPANGATDVSLSVDLTWTAGARAASHDVYFGTDATPDAGELQGNQPGTTFDPGNLSANTTYYWRIDEVNSAGTTAGNVWSFTTGDVSDEYAPLPYSTGFESGSVDEFWVLETQNSYGRLQVTSSNSPRGSYHLTSDVTTNGNYSTNAALLKVNLSGQSQVDLSFYWKEFNDENNTEDGVFISDDGGANYTKVYNLTGGNSTYSKIDIDIDQEASNNGLSLTGTFVIKFQHRDNYTLTTDGFAFDDISVSAGSTPPQGYPVQLTLNFDNYPEETRWEILDGSTIVESGGTYGSEPDGSTKIIEMELEAKCYDFVIYDSYGDGMCCGYGQGSYELTQNGTVLASGAEFGSSETTNFCVTATSEAELLAEEDVTNIVEADINYGIKLFPNPVVDYLTIRTESTNNSIYMIRDIVGKVVQVGNLDSFETQINMSGIAAGIYFIDLSIDGRNSSIKIIKK